MGKKKSVVLMVLLTIVIVVLTALTVLPTFSIPGTPKKWQPVALQYDFGTDLGGGYYAYYYPEGVITQTEFESNGESEEDYLKVGSLYLSKDEDDGIVSNGAVTEEFKTAFNAAAKEIANRFEAKGFSDYRLSIVDNYSIRVELPASQSSEVGSVMAYLALTGEVDIQMSGATVDELKEEGVTAKDLIKSVSVATKYKTAYMKVNFTSLGKSMIERVKEDLSTAPTSSSADTSSDVTLNIMIGEQVIAAVYQDTITSNNSEARVLAVAQDYKATVETFAILLNSALNNGGYDISFREVANSDIRAFEPVYGENAVTLLYIALAIVLVLVLVVPALVMGRYGLVASYSSLSYLIVVGMCFAFITNGVFEITLGSVLVFLAGLVLMNALHYSVYGAIKKEFDNGRTVEASVKSGFNKTLWNTVDIYAVLLLGALALLLGVAGTYTLALQAIICVVTGAFCNLLWARAINYTFLSASKNKYKYFRFVREDDDDE
ncbi:MAG: hypothetical protein IJB34_00460 [Clostridia bacterium]|nr:hypothetical protein [Clostridia bacterium]